MTVVWFSDFFRINSLLFIFTVRAMDG